MALSVVVFLILLYESGVYRSVLRYTGVYQGVRVASATAIATGVLFLADFVVELLWERPMPLSVLLVGAVLAYVQLVALRLYPMVFYELSLREVGQRDRALIVGAGEAGVTLARQLWRTPDADLKPVGFVDENERLRGEQIESIPVLGVVEDIESIVEERGIEQILIALPEASSEDMDRIWRECVKTGVSVKVVPKLAEFLERGTIELRELQISRLGPARLVCLERDESALFYLMEELARKGLPAAEPVVGDVTNTDKMRALFERVRPELVFHAAAYKHVPLMEVHASEAVANNVGGTLNIARCAGEIGAEKCVNISTDKAVSPVNVMGATKRLSENIVRSCAAEYPETVYASVRFGNVLGSRGSVVPTFKRQIEAGGPVTVTHPEMTRYFMMIPEAVSLVLQAGALVDSYGTYVLEMGNPVKIVDLARKMLKIMDADDVEIRYIGLRPGEKLHEILSEEDEKRVPTEHPMVTRLAPGAPAPSDLLDTVEEMTYLAREGHDTKALKLLRSTVPSYPATLESLSKSQ